MKTPAAALAFITLSILAPLLATAEDAPAFTGWKSASTAHFRFIFEDATRETADAFALVADESWNAVSRAYATPPDMTDVVLTARTDTVNAFAEGISHYMGFFTTPPASPDFGFRDDWHRVFFTHELIHIANYAFEGKKNVAADIFGPLANIFGDIDIAPWYLEGITTVLETELTTGGRGRSPYFELYYKSLALDNSFLSFEEIGTETKAPQGQIYIMGYVLMRSIADRFGLDALASIERNRTGGRNFLESVKFVTGYTADELFRDARIALLKKYARERSIDEGITLTPRFDDVYYHKPALVGSSGIITLRSGKDNDLTAVRVDPATRDETVLFGGSFADEYSLAAANDGTIVAALRFDRFDKRPGYTSETDLYTWDEKSGLSQLTDGTSLFQPALSRDGTRLVAVELAGAEYRLVEVNLSTGIRTVLYGPVGESCIQPALSADGTKIAFLSLDSTRATLCVAKMPPIDATAAGGEYPIPSQNVTHAVNGEGEIIDLANPSWTADGSLLYSSNERGRLEIWEYSDGERHPVLADPAGAVWADKTAEGIWYASYAGTGNVIKMKPVDRWGIVPDFDGPSRPGEIITLGALASDFPDFKPFAHTETDEDSIRVDASKQPVARAGDGEITDTTTKPQDEKKFINAPRPLVWFPLVNYIATDADSGAFGFGAFAAFTGYMMQSGSEMPMIAFGGERYPSIGQTDAVALATIPAFGGDVIALASRQLSVETDTDNFLETTKASVSLSLPISVWSFYKDFTDFAFITGVSAVAGRRDDAVFAANDAIAYATGINAQTGLEIAFGSERGINAEMGGRGSATLIASVFPAISRTTYVSAEADGTIRAGTQNALMEASFRTRWYDLPEDAPLPSTLVNLKGKTLSCLYPSRTILEAAIIFPDLVNCRIFGEKLISAGTNSRGMETPASGKPLNKTIDPDWYTGIEFETVTGRTQFAFGAVARLSDETFDATSDIRIYFTLKMDAITITERY